MTFFVRKTAILALVALIASYVVALPAYGPEIRIYEPEVGLVRRDPSPKSGSGRSDEGGEESDEVTRTETSGERFRRTLVKNPINDRRSRNVVGEVEGVIKEVGKEASKAGKGGILGKLRRG
jgi:hypothetical protein